MESILYPFFCFFFLYCFCNGRYHISRHNRIVVFFTSSTLFTLFTHNNYEYLRLCILTKILKLNITHDNIGRQNRSDVTGRTTRISYRASSWTDVLRHTMREICDFLIMSPIEKRSLSFLLLLLSFYPFGRQQI